ncbi:MAG: hypothetical protein C4581_04655 [Nitrospiraceae bacterium]|nr:MAG: hypothetical protein C4581_04655 [Nitrospiraceae bacterium]
MLPLSGDPPGNKSYYLPLLIIISIGSHFPFILNGFGEIDATKIAVSVIDILNNGSNAAFTNFYFSDVIPLYILYLKWFMRLLNYDYSYLPIVMNYTNAVFGTLTIVPAFLLIRQLYRNSTIAFCTVLALIFAPSFYQANVMGFPHLIAFFFLLVSLNFYLSGIDINRKSRGYFFLFPAGVFLTIAFLFKSDIVLVTGIYFGLLIINKIRDKGTITGSFLMILVSGVSFLILRNIILGPSSGTTMSKEGLSKWYAFSLILPSSIGYYVAQAKPIAYGMGIASFCMGLIAFSYYLFKKRSDVLVFIVSWAALPTIFWLIMIGNNARHNMITVLPVLVIIIVLFYEKAPRYTIILTIILILSNFLLTAPSYSILKPSGSLFKSNTLLEDRMETFQTLAKEITNIDDNKIAVLGTFHNPHVIIELMRTHPSYKASKIGRENYKIQVGEREYVFIYFVVVKPEDMKEGIDHIIQEYKLENHLFVSVTYYLGSLESRGLKIKKIDIIKRSGL